MEKVYLLIDYNGPMERYYGVFSTKSDLVEFLDDTFGLEDSFGLKMEDDVDIDFLEYELNENCMKLKEIPSYIKK